MSQAGPAPEEGAVNDHPEPLPRPIRSYVLREGRMTSAQRLAFERLWGRYGLNPAPGEQIQPEQIFGNRHPTWLEIGFGNGDALAQMAQAHPDRNWLGIEVHRPGVGHLILELEKQGVENVRLIRQDAVEVLHDFLVPGSLDAVLLFFPDPWPKRRHQKRRIVRPELVDLVARALRPGGLFHMATDWVDYAQQMREVTARSTTFENAAGSKGFVPRPEWRPLTRFERRGHRLGHEIRDLVLVRRPADDCEPSTQWSPGHNTQRR